MFLGFRRQQINIWPLATRGETPAPLTQAVTGQNYLCLCTSPVLPFLFFDFLGFFSLQGFPWFFICVLPCFPRILRLGWDKNPCFCGFSLPSSKINKEGGQSFSFLSLGPLPETSTRTPPELPRSPSPTKGSTADPLQGRAKGDGHKVTEPNLLFPVVSCALQKWKCFDHVHVQTKGVC